MDDGYGFFPFFPFLCDGWKRIEWSGKRRRRGGGRGRGRGKEGRREGKGDKDDEGVGSSDANGYLFPIS